MINRRAFLARLGFGTVAAAAAIATFDLEKLLWVPGERTFFLPAPVQPFNIDLRFITPDWVVKEMVDMFAKQYSIVDAFYRQPRADYGQAHQFRIGETIRVRRPSRYDYLGV